MWLSLKHGVPVSAQGIGAQYVRELPSGKHLHSYGKITILNG